MHAWKRLLAMLLTMRVTSSKKKRRTEPIKRLLQCNTQSDFRFFFAPPRWQIKGIQLPD
jgi:hypothetical protein